MAGSRFMQQLAGEMYKNLHIGFSNFTVLFEFVIRNSF